MSWYDYKLGHTETWPADNLQFSEGVFETQIRIPHKQSFQILQCYLEGKIGWLLLDSNWIEKIVDFCHIASRILSLIYGFGISRVKIKFQEFSFFHKMFLLAAGLHLDPF